MPGWMCYVQGRLDPTDFFYGLTLAFDHTPHLAELKRSIEEGVLGNNLVTGGASDYIVGDVEILDFRLNAWICLDSRSQLYSGCHIAAIRDLVSGTCAGPFETCKKPIEAKALGFALQAKEVYDALDADCEGVLRLKSVLKALRHDVNYAVDVFNKFDVRATGAVSYVDFKSVFNSTGRTYIEELKERLRHGGRSIEGKGGEGSTDFGAGGSNTPVAGAPVDSVGTLAGGIPVVALRGKINPTSYHANQADIDEAKRSRISPKSSPKPESPQGDEGGGGPSSDDGEAARKVVALLQKSINKKREQTNAAPGGGVSASVLSKLKGFAKKSSAAGTAPGSPGGPAPLPFSPGSDAGSAGSGHSGGGSMMHTLKKNKTSSF